MKGKAFSADDSSGSAVIKIKRQISDDRIRLPGSPGSLILFFVS